MLSLALVAIGAGLGALPGGLIFDPFVVFGPIAESGTWGVAAAVAVGAFHARLIRRADAERTGSSKPE